MLQNGLHYVRRLSLKGGHFSFTLLECVRVLSINVANSFRLFLSICIWYKLLVTNSREPCFGSGWGLVSRPIGFWR